MFAAALRARRALASAVVSLMALALTGCAAFSDDADGVGLDDGLQVVAAFYPLQYLAQRVVGDRAEVANLTTPGSEPHDLEIPPRQTAEIADADVVVHERGFQPAVDDAIRQNATGEVLDAAAVCRPPRAKDPHFWQDPLRIAEVGDALADRLSEVDPDHADEYASQRSRPPHRPGVAGRGVRAGAGRLRAHHGGGLARRLRVPHEVRSRHGAHRRPLPRRRADAGRPRSAAAADP